METEIQPAPASPALRPHPALAIVAGALGWFVPGAGHLILKRWLKAAVYFLAVALLAFTGLMMRGNVFHSNGADAFEMLGFLADLGNGILYFLAGKINPAGPDVAHAAGDYGTRLIAAAGVLNLLCALEAFETGWRGQEREIS